MFFLVNWFIVVLLDKQNSIFPESLKKKIRRVMKLIYTSLIYYRSQPVALPVDFHTEFSCQRQRVDFCAHFHRKKMIKGNIM